MLTHKCSYYHVHVLIHFPLGFEINAKKNVFFNVKWSCQNKRGYIKRGLLSGPTRVIFNLVKAVTKIHTKCFKVASLYDPERELRTYQLLSSYQIAPHLYANGAPLDFLGCAACEHPF